MPLAAIGLDTALTVLVIVVICLLVLGRFR